MGTSARQDYVLITSMRRTMMRCNPERHTFC
jgi:hypothetical protein